MYCNPFTWTLLRKGFPSSAGLGLASTLMHSSNPLQCPHSLPTPTQQAFASPAKLAELVGRVNAALGPGGALSAAVSRMRLYLPTPATAAILLKPVKSNIAEAHGQVARLLQVNVRKLM
jgi:hypothetical protein